jgi:hypothetical protein
LLPVFVCVAALSCVALMCPAQKKGDGRPHKRGLGGTTTTTTVMGCNAGGCTGRGVCKGGMLKSGSGGCPGTVFACNSDGTIFSITLDVTTIDTSSYYTWRPLCRCNPGTTVTFDFPFDISVNCTTVPYVDTFNLPAGTIIPAGVPFPVTYAAGHNGHQMATITITPTATTPQPLQVIFGIGTTNIDNASPGIAQIGTGQFTANGGAITSIPATFMLKPGAADTLVLTFKDKDLTKNQPQQASLFNFSTGQYGSFSSTFCTLGYPQFNQAGLPPNAFVPITVVPRISQSSDAVWDTMFMPYYAWELPLASYAYFPTNTSLGIMYQMPYNAPMSAAAWGWGTVNIYSYNPQDGPANSTLVISQQSNGGGNPGWPIDLNTTPMPSDLGYYYTIVLPMYGCAAGNTTPQLTSQQYFFTVPPSGGGGQTQKMLIKQPQKNKKK